MHAHLLVLAASNPVSNWTARWNAGWNNTHSTSYFIGNTVGHLAPLALIAAVILMLLMGGRKLLNGTS